MTKMIQSMSFSAHTLMPSIVLTCMPRMIGVYHLTSYDTTNGP